VPPLVFLVVRALCRELQESDRIEHDRELAEEEAERVEAELRARAQPVV
jgi:hypothetical protein